MGIRARTLNPIKAAQVLFFLNAAIWLLFGVISLARMATSGSGRPIATVVVAILMLGNAGAMLVAGIGTGKRHRLLYY